MEENVNYNKNLVKFIILSAIGIFMFFIPIDVNGLKTIPVEALISAFIDKFNKIVKIYALIVILVASILPFIKKTWNENKSNIVFSFAKIIGAIFSLMVFFNFGPEAVLRSDHGPFLFDSLAVQVGTLIPFCGIFLTFIMDYGFIDFIGQFLRPIMRRVFTTPGRSAVDAVASFTGSTASGVLITNEMFKSCRYTEREAAVIVTNFSTVSVSFFVLVAKTGNIIEYWDNFFIVALFTTFVTTIFTARMYPLKNKKDTYYLGKDGIPEIPLKGNIFKEALNEAVKTCEKAGPVIPRVKDNIVDSFKLIFEILPNLMSIGLIALLLAAYTPIFDVLGYILYPITLLLRIPEPLLAAKASFLGLAEMFLPVMLIKDAPDITRFIVCVMSISQVIMFSTTIPAILATDIPVSVMDMVIIWFERTIITFLIVTPIAMLII